MLRETEQHAAAQKAVMNTELDADVARLVMGWTVHMPNETPPDDADLSRYACLHPGQIGLQRYKLRRGDGYEMWHWHRFYPSSILNDTHEMEAMIPENWRGQYAARVMHEVEAVNPYPSMYDYIHATAEQRARAAVATMLAAKEQGWER